MNLFSVVLPAADLMGQVLLHFLWQGALIAGGLALSLGAARNQPSALRHHLACLALLLMAACPVVTAAVLAESAARVGIVQAAPLQTSSSPVLTPLRMVSPVSLPALGFPWMPVLALAWSAGVMVLCVRLVGGWWHAVRRIHEGATPAPAEWQLRLQALQERFHVHPMRPIRLLESLRAEGPLVMGWLKPVILFPAGLLAGLPASQVEALLLHELAHVRHHDFLINLVQRVVETLLFFHPAVWWVSSQIRQERERRCDDWVVMVQGDGVILAGALLTLAEQSSATPGFALAAGDGSVADRIRRLVGAPSSGPSQRRNRWWLGTLATLVLVLVGLFVARHLIATPMYQSTARVRIEASPAAGGMEGHDPYQIATAVESIRSQNDLTTVVERLNLAQRWRISPGEAVQRLRSQLSVNPYRNTSLFEITVSSHDRAEAAELANAVADQCVGREQSSHAQRRKLVEEQDAEKLRALDDLISDAEKQLQAAYGSNGLSVEYREKVKDLEMLRELKRQKRREIIVRQLDSSPQPPSRFEIIDAATPALRPLRGFVGFR